LVVVVAVVVTTGFSAAVENNLVVNVDDVVRKATRDDCVTKACHEFEGRGEMRGMNEMIGFYVTRGR
jgi:hypothetical protein